MDIRTDKAEVTLQLDEKVLQLFQQAAMQVSFRMDAWQTKKFHSIRVPEDTQSFGIHLCRQWRHF